MHPFGGTPICPRCSKAVYAAEQMMGPGRRLYHKPCLACMSCNKRLDSYSLVEHDQEPYCKPCHVKNFGTRDLRHGNLPNLPASPPTSPTRTSPAIHTPTWSPAPSLPLRRTMTGNTPYNYAPSSGSSPGPASLLQPTRSLSSTRARSVDLTIRSPTFTDSPQETDERLTSKTEEEQKEESSAAHISSSTNETAHGGPPPLPPRSVEATNGNGTRSPTKFGSPATFGRSNGAIAAPLIPTATGTRYGVALTGGARSGALTPMATGGRQWGGGTPSCAKCGKSVYFAEQVKAVGKTFHKSCLRCTECNSTLDSMRLTEKDGEVYCRRCYSKSHGPVGSGYALLGKAGS